MKKALLVAGAVLALAATRCTLLDSLDYLHDGTGCDPAVKLQTDPKNCGVCGHDCQGGACQASVCQPVTLASGWRTPFDLALDSTSLYFTAGVGDADAGAGAVVRCSQDGCATSMTVIAPHEDGPTRIAIDATRAYWTEFTTGEVHACPLTGCDGPPTVIARGQPNAQGIAVDATSIYWDQNVDPSGAVLSCPLAGCPASGPAVLAAVDGPGTLAVSGATLAFVANPHGAVDVCPVGGCPSGVTTLAGGGSSSYSPYFLVTYGDLVYWTDNEAAGGIYACALTGCGDTAAQIAPEVNPVGLAVDASGVYWSTDTNLGTIRHCPVSGCNGASPDTLAVAQGHPFAIKLSDTSVFWTVRDSGTVLKIAKPARAATTGDAAPASP